MFHPSTEFMIDYWRGRRGNRSLPGRSDIDPSGFAAQAARVFVAARDGASGDLRFRLAGEAVIDLHGRTLKGESLARFWRPQHRRPLSMALGAALIGAQTVVVAAEASMTSGPALQLEIFLAPYAGADGRADRLLGHVQPLAPAAGQPLRELRMLAINGAERSPLQPYLRLAVLNGQRIG
jgi:hypothetical protein